MLYKDDADKFIPIQQFSRPKVARVDQGVLLKFWRIS